MDPVLVEKMLNASEGLDCMIPLSFKEFNCSFSITNLQILPHLEALDGGQASPGIRIVLF